MSMNSQEATKELLRLMQQPNTRLIHCRRNASHHAIFYLPSHKYAGNIKCPTCNQNSKELNTQLSKGNHQNAK